MRLLQIAAVASAVLVPTTPARADKTADFFRQSGVTIVVGFVVGGGYDVYARLLGRHMGRHIPGNPSIIIRNMPGAGSMAAANYIYTNAPKDGSTIGTFSRSIPTQPLFDRQGVQFDALKLNWIGSPASEVSVIFSPKANGFKSLDDLRSRPMRVPASGLGADSAIYPFVTNAILGTRLKVVTGYQGSGDFMLAIERGEVDGMGGSSISTLRSTRPQWLKDKLIDVHLQLALNKHPDFPDVPLIVDLAKSPEDKKVLELIFSRQLIAFPFAAPPNIPEDRLNALREGFEKTLRDPQFLAEAEKFGIEVAPVSASEIMNILTSAYSAAPSILERARSIVLPPN